MLLILMQLLRKLVFIQKEVVRRLRQTYSLRHISTESIRIFVIVPFSRRFESEWRSQVPERQQREAVSSVSRRYVTQAPQIVR